MDLFALVCRKQLTARNCIKKGQADLNIKTPRLILHGGTIRR
jgi:hypothetical protein